MEETENGDVNTARAYLKNYKAEFPFDLDIYSIDASLCMKEGNAKKALNLTIEGLAKSPFKFDLTCNLAILTMLAGDSTTAVQQYAKSSLYCNNEEEKKRVTELGEFILSQMTNEKQRDDLVARIKEVDKDVPPGFFPLKSTEKSFIGQEMFLEGKDCYLPNYYKMYEPNYELTFWRHCAAEILKGQFIRTPQKETKIKIDAPCVIPISVQKSKQHVEIQVNEQPYELKNLIANQFYYLPVNENGVTKIESTNDFFVGNKIRLKDEINPNDKRLVLNIFIDGLAENIIQGGAFARHMPHTYKFFKHGVRFTNCFATGEWTVPSVASIFTGNYTVTHNLFHPKFPYDIGKEQPLLSNVFQNNDYLTFQICCDWGKSPSYGYAKGFDRTLYHASREGFKCENVLLETIEQLKSFKHRKQFGWISLFELHEIYDFVTPTISSQLKNSLHSMTDTQRPDKSVGAAYSDKMVERYKTELERLDFYLNILYQHINDNYSKDEILVTLLSDHGQSYISHENGPIRSTRQNVPFMITGGKIHAAVSDELIENVDIFNILTHKGGIQNRNFKTDGNLPKTLGGHVEREYTYSETIFPGKIYGAGINDKTHHFTFETENVAHKDGTFDIEPYKISLMNKSSNTDEQELYPEKIEKYLKVVFDHVKGNLRI